MTPKEKKEYYDNLIAIQYHGKVDMDSIINHIEFDGGYWIYTNHKEVVHTDMNGIERTSYTADAEWVEQVPT